MENKIDKQTIIRHAKEAKSKPPIILGSCDFVCKELVKDLKSSFHIPDRFIELYVVNVRDKDGNRYADGHMVVYIDDKVVGGRGITVDATLDQFKDNFNVRLEKLGIRTDKEVWTFNGVPSNQQIYEVRRVAPYT